MHIDSQYLLTLLIRTPPVLLALTLHEVAHGWVAWRCGDPTAKQMGRLTLNPVAHLDLLGTICLMFGPIGWAKPVPIAPDEFRHPRRDQILVSLAGVTTNFLLAMVLSGVFRIVAAAGYDPQGQLGAVLILMLYMGILVNLGLCFFNLLPIAPLDGHHVVREMLPRGARARFMEYSRYGPILLLGLVLLGGGAGLRFLVYPISFFMRLFAGPEIIDYYDKALVILQHGS